MIQKPHSTCYLIASHPASFVLALGGSLELAVSSTCQRSIGVSIAFRCPPPADRRCHLPLLPRVLFSYTWHSYRSRALLHFWKAKTPHQLPSLHYPHLKVTLRIPLLVGNLSVVITTSARYITPLPSEEATTSTFNPSIQVFPLSYLMFSTLQWLIALISSNSLIDLSLSDRFTYPYYLT